MSAVGGDEDRSGVKTLVILCPGVYSLSVKYSLPLLRFLRSFFFFFFYNKNKPHLCPYVSPSVSGCFCVGCSRRAMVFS